MVQLHLLWYLSFSSFISQCKTTTLSIERIQSSSNQLILTDFLDNPSKETEFCTSRNANCLNIKSSYSCRKCRCEEKDTFVSYKHGCKNFKESLKLSLIHI